MERLPSLDTLRVFSIAARHMSFTKAADELHLTQSAISHRVRALEEELGVPLFDRLPRSVVATEAGKYLLEYARKILVEIADARRCLDELKREVVGRLAVGAIPTITPYVLPELIGKFQHRYPKVTLEILEDTTERLVRRLEDGELDIAFVSTCDESPALERHSLGREALLVLLPKGHKLGKKKKIKWSDLKSQKFLLLHEMHCLSAQVYQFLAANHLRPELAVTGAQLGTIARMVAAGMGVSLVPQMMIEAEPVTGCVALPFAPPVPVRELNLVRNPLRFQSKAAAAFHQEAAAAFSSKPNAH